MAANLSLPPLVVDGSYGEGGGQILRTAVAMATILKRPVEVRNIRAKRGNPGLRPQHLTALKAIAELCDARVEQLYIGSSAISFYPGEARSKQMAVDVGTAGSITLLLQAIIPAASICQAHLHLKVKGGTDVRWSPTLDYFRFVVLPTFSLLGVKARLHVLRRGYYPEGGGLVEVEVEPATSLQGLQLFEAPSVTPKMMSICSRLPRSVAERQRDAALKALSERGVKVGEILVLEEDAPSPGTAICIYSVGERGPFIGGDAIGERGKAAEAVGREAATHYLKALETGAPLDNHVADMLVTVLALASSPSQLRVAEASLHLTTNLYVANLFTGCRYELSSFPQGGNLLRITPGEASSSLADAWRR